MHEAKRDDSERLEEIREQIRSLQQEQARSLQEIALQQKQKEEVNKDLEAERDKLAVFMDKLDAERREERLRREKDSAEREEMERRARMRVEVDTFLRSRVPIMAMKKEEEEEQGAGEEATAEKGASKGQGREEEEHQEDKRVHDTVLVSYFRAGKAGEDYKVAYRIGPRTTLDELHRDACAYWGCSHNEYFLWRVGKEDKMDQCKRGDVEFLQQDNDVLPPTEMAHLYLVSKRDEEEFKKAMEKIIAKQKQEAELGEARAPGGAQAEGAAHAHIAKALAVEPFVDAMKPWPGIHELLHRRHRGKEHPYRYVRCLDFLCFAILLLLSAIGFQLQSIDLFDLRSGVLHTLGDGIPGESTVGPAISIANVSTVDDFWPWLAGSFHYQVYNGSSSLRRMYTPVGFVRIRQQKVSKTSCPDRRIPNNIVRPCHAVGVTQDTQDKATYLSASSKEAVVFQRILNASTSPGRLAAINPFIWRLAEDNDALLYGDLQSTYDGSGFEIAYDFSPAAAATFLSHLPFLRTTWVTAQTRLLVVELAIANYNYGGYASVRLVAEIAPSGAIQMWPDVLIFRLGKLGSDGILEMLTVLRWILVIGYLLAVRLWSETSELAKMGRRRLAYFLTPEGLFDLSTMGVFFAAQKLHGMTAPPFPLTVRTFYSYHYYAENAQTVSILESVFILMLLLRMASFCRMNPVIHRFFKMLGRSAWLIVTFCLMFLPIMLGNAMLAHAIWSPRVASFRNYLQSFMAILVAARQSFFEVQAMTDTGGWWSIPFLIYFLLSTTTFQLNMFVAITTHALFETQLVDVSLHSDETWKWDQWLDWLLPSPLFKLVSSAKPGISRIVGYEDGGESDSGVDEDEDDDDDRDD